MKYLHNGYMYDTDKMILIHQESDTLGINVVQYLTPAGWDNGQRPVFKCYLSNESPIHSMYPMTYKEIQAEVNNSGQYIDEWLNRLLELKMIQEAT